MPKGANIRFNDLAPGQSVPMVSILFLDIAYEETADMSVKHRTQSTDYNIILNGSLYLLTPLLASDGTLKTAMQETLCNPGDVILQRGTLHGWENRSSEWVRWISVLLGADENKVEVEWKPEKVVLPNSFWWYNPIKATITIVSINIVGSCIAASILCCKLKL